MYGTARTDSQRPADPPPSTSSPGVRGLPDMGELRVHDVPVSLDGYAAGPARSVENPLRVGGALLHG